MSDAAGHGTNAAYQRHLTAREPPCRLCKDAHAACPRKPAPRLPAEAVDIVARALELELGGWVRTQSLRWAAVIALRTALALVDGKAEQTDPP